MVWNRCTSQVPKPIVDDFNTFLTSSTLPRMQDTVNYGTKNWANHTVRADGQEVVFKLAEIAAHTPWTGSADVFRTLMPVRFPFTPGLIRGPNGKAYQSERPNSPLACCLGLK